MQRTAVVTGATRGIGHAISEQLVASGTRVFMLARSQYELTDVTGQLGSLAVPLVCDVSDAAAVNSAVERIASETNGAPDIVVNNAGLFPLSSMHTMPVVTFEQTLEVNVVAPFRFVHAFLPTMRERKSGHIVTIGSVADRQIFPENGAYAASKHAQRAMHEVLRQELSGTGVRASLVSPGPTDTSIWDEIDPDNRQGFLNRASMLSASAVANAVLWVVSAPRDVNVDELRISRA
ncbi:MAG: SDR family oxidoreductase [Gemmatimonadaceae bacterium]